MSVDREEANIRALAYSTIKKFGRRGRNILFQQNRLKRSDKRSRRKTREMWYCRNQVKKVYEEETEVNCVK